MTPFRTLIAAAVLCTAGLPALAQTTPPDAAPAPAAASPDATPTPAPAPAPEAKTHVVKKASHKHHHVAPKASAPQTKK